MQNLTESSHSSHGADIHPECRKTSWRGRQTTLYLRRDLEGAFGAARTWLIVLVDYRSVAAAPHIFLTMPYFDVCIAINQAIARIRLIKGNDRGGRCMSILIEIFLRFPLPFTVTAMRNFLNIHGSKIGGWWSFLRVLGSDDR